MPSINEYKCNNCDFVLPTGWGGYLYVEDDNGKKITCRHPLEEATIKEVLGHNSLAKLIKGKTIKKRVGYNSKCLCLDCLYQFDADLADENKEHSWRHYYETKFGMIGGKDKRECPKCKSKNIKTLAELINETCPKCKKGAIKEIETGVVC